MEERSASLYTKNIRARELVDKIESEVSRSLGLGYEADHAAVCLHSLFNELRFLLNDTTST